jgi:hypothetical protein
VPIITTIRGNTSPFGKRATFLKDSTGGTITTAGGYRIHTFQTGERAGASYTFTAGAAGTVEYLIVAGGGAGGTSNSGAGGGGGGAGGFRTGSLSITAGDINVVVGSGGTKAVQNPQVDGLPAVAATDGGNSSIGVTSSIGGGAGADLVGSDYTGSRNQGRPGGSGGGGGAGPINATSGLGGAPTSGQGFRGGNGANTGPGSSYNASSGAGYKAGGGGGAGARGQDGQDVTPYVGAAGGNGLSSSISGSSILYAGGGGSGNIWSGWQYPISGGAGGSGGGGAGGNIAGVSSSVGGTGTNGTNGRGGGGGGAGYNAANSADGGSGIVIIRYAI